MASSHSPSLRELAIRRGLPRARLADEFTVRRQPTSTSIQ
jgi:hypothetical protein